MQRRKYNKERELKTGDEPSAANPLVAAPGQPAACTVSVATKIWHYTIYATDGYVNIDSGAWPPAADNTTMAGWGPSFAGPADIVPNNNPGPVSGPIYIWGFTDIDPDLTLDGGLTFPNRVPVPAGAYGPAIGSQTGNAKLPGPYLEAKQHDHVFVTLYNRGFYQNQQMVQDDHSLHWHGIHAQTPYDGFPETAGKYVEYLRYFWEEPWYQALGGDVRARDAKWNSFNVFQQRTRLNDPANLAAAVIRPNRLNPSGAVTNKRNTGEAYPFGTMPGTIPIGETPDTVSQFTYYFTPHHPGTFFYHCHVAASEHIQMGMYGALIIRPMDYDPAIPANKTAYGVGTNTDFDSEYTFMISEFDARWHKMIEGDPAFASFYLANWRPDIWMVNGRTFPNTVLPFKWNTPQRLAHPASYWVEPRYDMYVKGSANQKILQRWINIGYQEHPMHQHGWMMRVVGKDAMPKNPQYEQFTTFMGSGESWDTITLFAPAYNNQVLPASGGVSPGGPACITFPHPNAPSVLEPAGTLNWRQVYPIHDHDDYRVTTNGFYPGGAVILMEVCFDPNSLPNCKPTWENPYIAPTPPFTRAINILPSPCPGLPPGQPCPPPLP